MKREVLRIQNLTLRELEEKKLDGFCLHVNEGELIHLLGISNAGKTMLYQYFTGRILPEEGFAQYQNKRYEREIFGGMKDMVCIGENSSLIEGLSIAENICIITGRRKMKQLIHKKALNYRVNLLLNQYAKGLKAEMKISSLDTVRRHEVELLRVMENEIPLIYIDDAFKNYGQDDLRHIGEIMQALRERGTAIIYATRRNDSISRWADRKVVMRNGRNVKTFYREDYQESLCRKWLTGSSQPETFTRQTYRQKELVFSGLIEEGKTYLHQCSIEVHKGEIVGLYDMNNRANYEFTNTILGKVPVKSGQFYLNGKRYIPYSLEKAIKSGIGYIPREHKGSSVVESMTFSENLLLPIMLKMSVLKIFKNMRVNKYLEREYLKLCSIDERERNLKMKEMDSYQKANVEFRKWILARPCLLICEEICEELDIQMRNIIYSALNEMAENGTAVCIASSNMDELKKICDTVYVMNTVNPVSRVKTVNKYQK